ncbi:unnamed protein product [Rhizophagus irregularis]|nr:unnamed protein product [Rhizophagus irregularis]
MSGRRYWMDGKRSKKERLFQEKNTTCYFKIFGIKLLARLLDKDISHRMKLDRFMRTSYYIMESESTNINKFESINGELFQLYRTKFTRLKGLNDKIDNCKRDVEDLTDLTKNIPQWLVKLQNEKVPRVFVMIPDQKIGKNQFFYTQGTVARSRTR